MRTIGDTISGTFIVEMSREEWISLNGDAPQREVAYEPQDKNKWYQRFRIDLHHLNLSTRYHNALLRCIFDNGQAKTEELVFATDGRYLDFEEWIFVLGERKDALLKVRNLGRLGAKSIIEAADRYVLERVRTPEAAAHKEGAL